MMNTRLWPLVCVAALSLAIGCGDDGDGGGDDPDTGLDTGGGDDTGGTDGGGADTGGTDTGDDGGTGFVVPELVFEEIPLDGDGAVIGTEMRFIPGTSEFLILEKDGVVSHFALDGDQTTYLGEFTISNINTALDCGLLGLTFDPDFETNKYMYVSLCTSVRASGVYRYTWNAEDYGAIDGTAAEIISAEEPAAGNPWHNVGGMGFDESGALWALFGEKTVSANGQDPSNFLGAMVRVIPNREADGSGYTVPEDNPYVGVDGFAPEIYAWGLRSPWRGLRDHRGHYWIGDVGADEWEELNLVSEPGQNFGWPAHEGACSGSCDDFVDPIAQYGHSDEDEYIYDDVDAEPVTARSVWVGVEYEDRGNDPYDGALTNRVLFGDFCLGFVRLIESDDNGQVVRDVHVGHLAHASGWDQGPDGHIYVVTFGACETRDLDPPPATRLYRVIRNNP